MRIEREITMLAYQIRRPRRPLARLSQRRSAIAPDGRRLAFRSGKRLGTPERAAGGTTAGRSGRPCSRTGSTSLIPPVSSRVHQCRRAACLERFPSRDARPPYCDGAIVVRPSGGRDAEWRLRSTLPRTSGWRRLVVGSWKLVVGSW